MILIIDNYDSFTYNLVQYFGELGAEVCVFRNDAILPEDVESHKPDYLVISPGPCTPKEAGNSVAIIQHMAGKVPILGVCLGHQCIAEAFGGNIIHAHHIMHGKTDAITHDSKGVFSALPNPLTATRYHSLAVDKESLPAELLISAYASDGEIMGLRHKTLAIESVQFHPESIATPEGKKLLNNFIRRSTSGSFMSMKDALNRVVTGGHLTEREMRDVMMTIMEGEATNAQIAGLLVGLRMKGETVDELTGAVTVMREKAFHVAKPSGKRVVDTCGTGGDGAHTFNISTAAAFIAAGAGVIVAKHGNRAVSSQCGSADVLRELGVNITMPPESLAECLEQNGIAFLFAPLMHSAMKYAIGPRREIAVRSIFNMIGPLINPAQADAQVMGVFHEGLTETMAEVFNRLGLQQGMIVHGHDGLDEITLTTTTKITELKNGHINTYVFDPREYGFSFCRSDDISGGSIAENAEYIRHIISEIHENDPRQEIATINAAAAIIVSGNAENWIDALFAARHSIDSGAALEKLHNLISYTARCI